MTFQEREELKIKTDKIANKAWELMDENTFAKDLWELFRSSYNWQKTGEQLDENENDDYFIKLYYEEKNLKAKNKFYENFLEFIKKYNK